MKLQWRHPRVQSLITTRHGGFSSGPFASLNLGLHVGDDAELVRMNREKLRQQLPGEPVWLNQVHGTQVHVVTDAHDGSLPTADACVTNRSGVVLTIMTADCLPVLFCAQDGSVIGAAHAGWRGLHLGILEQTVYAMQALSPTSAIECHFGPAIGPQAFEVGADVRDAFIALDPANQSAFVERVGAPQPRWLADICRLASLRLSKLDVVCLDQHSPCTVNEANRWFSYRRDGKTGRMASCLWLC